MKKKDVSLIRQKNINNHTFGIHWDKFIKDVKELYSEDYKSLTKVMQSTPGNGKINIIAYYSQFPMFI